MKEATNSISNGKFPDRVNLPSSSVAIPFVVLLTKTLAKGSGRPEPFSRTTPLTVCAAMLPKVKKEKDKT